MDPISGLAKNACCAKDCPFFLQVTDDFDAHYGDMCTLCPDYVHGLHRSIKQNICSDTSDILKRVARGADRPGENKNEAVTVPSNLSDKIDIIRKFY